MGKSRQMYKVFFNNVLLLIIDSDEKELVHLDEFIPVDEKAVFSPNYWSEWLETESHLNVVFCTDHLSEFWERFYTAFKEVIAAGGVVRNDKNEILYIYRNGKWDLPKGKVESGEVFKATAIREVEEETNVRVDEEATFCALTYHCYQYKGKFVLKPTHWYEMRLLDAANSTPQIEEGIEQVVLGDADFLKNTVLQNTYRSIADLLVKATNSRG